MKEHALNELLRRYQGTVDWMLTRRRLPSPRSVEDLRQDFFTQFIRRDDFFKLDKELGSFRALLRKAVDNFRKNEWDKWHAAKRGNGVTRPLAAEAQYTYTPEHHFRKRFTVDTLMHVLGRLEDTAPDKDEFARLRRYLPGPAMCLSDFEVVAAELRISVAHLHVKIFRLREKFKALLHEVVADLLDVDPKSREGAAAVEQELLHLYAALSTPASSP